MRRVPDVTAPEIADTALLLANHGPVVTGLSLDSAVFTAAVLEETAKLVILTRSLPVRRLGAEKIAALNSKFSLK